MRGLYWLIRKDISIFFSDVSGALMTIIMPAALALLLGSIFQPPGDMGPISVLLVNEDQGPVGIAWEMRLRERQDLTVTVTDREDAVSLVGRGLAPMAIFVPNDASEKLSPEELSRGTMPRLSILEDPAKQVEAMRVRGVLTELSVMVVGQRLADPSFTLQLVQEGQRRLSENTVGNSPRSGRLLGEILSSTEELIQPFASLPLLPIPFPDSLGEWAIQLDAEPFPEEMGKQREGYHSYSHAFAGMVCMFLLFFGLERSKQELREKQDGTHFRVATTPVSHGAMLLGSWLSTSAIALLSALITYGVGWITVDVVVHGSIPGFLCTLIAMSWMVGGFSLMMGNVCQTNQTLTSLGTLIVLVMSFVGGAWAPSFVLSDFLQKLGLWMPTSWATEGLAAVTWRGLEFDAALAPALALFAFGSAFGCVAWLLSWKRSHS